jgi:hypothetical protein
MLLASVGTMLMIPHPLWRRAGAIVLLSGSSYLGARLAAGPVRARDVRLA